MSCQVSRRACGSRPVVSSSRIAIFGLPTSASAIDSRCFWPPDSLPNCGLALVGEPEIVEQPLRIAGLGVERGVEVHRFPDADLVRQLALLELDADDPTELVAVWRGSSPSTLIVPESGVRSPLMDSTVVVLPAPFGPRMAKISPSSTEKETPSTAVRSP